MIEGIPFDWNNTCTCLYYPDQSSKCDVLGFTGKYINIILRVQNFANFGRIFEIREILHSSNSIGSQ